MSRNGMTFVAAMMFASGFAAISTVQAQDKGAKMGPKASTETSDEVGPRAAIRIQNIHRLRQMIDEKIKLSPDQAAKINRLFDAYVDDVKASYTGRKRAPREPRPNQLIPATMPQLEAQRKKAEAEGDTKKLEEINQAMSDLRREPQVPGENYSEYLTSKVREELKADQVEVFDKVVQRWSLIVPRGPRTGPVQRLRRAVKDPEIGVSADVQKFADERIQEAMKVARRGSESSEEKLEAEVEAAKADIFEKLTPEQRKKVDANIAAFKSVEKQYDDSKARARESGVLKKKPKATDKGAGVEKAAQPADAAAKPAEAQKP